MTKIFSYETTTNNEDEPINASTNTRIIGLVQIVSASLYLFTQDNFTFQGYENFLACALIAIGLFYIAFPLKVSNFFLRYKTEYLKIDDQKIEWNLGEKPSKNKLTYNNIASWSLKVGEVHFETKSGKVHRLKTHRITNKEKHDEFYKLLNSDLKKHLA